MIKLKEILHSLYLIKEDEVPVSDVIPAGNKNLKTINDEFRVNDWMLADIQKMLEKVNKKLKARNMPELQLEILNSEWVNYRKDLSTGLSSELFRKFVHTIKIVGDIPEIKDYEFIAKIEHGEDGNIINMAPNNSVEKLPNEYKTSNQKCDICKTNRERYNTFIIKKVNTGELICAGSGCLKKFMPLDVVKAMVDYSIQLNDLRNVLADYDANWDDENYGGGGGGGRIADVYEPRPILVFCLIAYFEDSKTYLSQTKAQEWGKESTLSKGLGIEYHLTHPGRTQADREAHREAKELFEKYGKEAETMADDVLAWAKTVDFDKKAEENPKMDAYFNNLKVLLGRKYLERKHLGYFSSFISLYIREKEIASEKKKRAPIEYFGNIGDKFVDRKVTLQFLTWFDSAYGTMYIYSFYDEDGYNFVYKGKDLPVSKDDIVLLSGTIKSHQDYKGTKQTIIQRPKIKEIKK